MSDLPFRFDTRYGLVLVVGIRLQCRPEEIEDIVRRVYALIPDSKRHLNGLWYHKGDNQADAAVRVQQRMWEGLPLRRHAPWSEEPGIVRRPLAEQFRETMVGTRPNWPFGSVSLCFHQPWIRDISAPWLAVPDVHGVMVAYSLRPEDDRIIIAGHHLAAPVPAASAV